MIIITKIGKYDYQHLAQVVADKLIISICIYTTIK